MYEIQVYPFDHAKYEQSKQTKGSKLSNKYFYDQFKSEFYAELNLQKKYILKIYSFFLRK